MKEIIEKAREWALEETAKNETPVLEHLNISNQKGQEIAEKLGVDKDIVMLGTLLMDIKLGECKKEGKIEEHTRRSAESTREFLTQFNLDDETVNRIVNCVEGHHGTVPWICKEAEVCANADCYRFITPRGVFAFMRLQGQRGNSTDKAIERVEAKLDEKWGILTLDVCKKELEPYYKMFKELLQKAREST